MSAWNWEATIRFEDGTVVSGGFELFYEMQKHVFALKAHHEGVVEIKIIPWLDHRSNEYWGAATPYDRATGEWIETCKCGRTFRCDDEGGSRALLGEHCESPEMSDEELWAQLGWSS